MGLHLFDLIFNCQVCTALDALDLALHTSSGSDLGRLECFAVDQELAFSFEVNLLVAFLLIRIIVWVAWRFAMWLSCTAIGSKQERTARQRICVRCFKEVGQGHWLRRGWRRLS